MNFRLENFMHMSPAETGGAASNYTRLDESWVIEAQKNAHEKVSTLVSFALNGHSNMHGGEADYDGLFVYQDGSSKFLVASPEIFMRNAELVSMRIGDGNPVLVHVSKEVEKEMSNLATEDIGSSVFVATSKPNIGLIEASRHPAVKKLCDSLNCRQSGDIGIILPDFYEGGYCLGPRRIVSTVYRIDTSVLSNLGVPIHFDRTVVEDLDSLGNLTAELQKATGLELRTGSYGKHLNYYVVGISERDNPRTNGVHSIGNLVDYDVARSVL